MGKSKEGAGLACELIWNGKKAPLFPLLLSNGDWSNLTNLKVGWGFSRGSWLNSDVLRSFGLRLLLSTASGRSWLPVEERAVECEKQRLN